MPDFVENHVYSMDQTWEKVSTFLLSDYKAVIAYIQVDGGLFLGTSGVLYSLLVKKNRSIAEF